MQNDALASAALLERASEEKKKQILAFLEKRRQYRSHVPGHPASEAAIAQPVLAATGAQVVDTAVPTEGVQQIQVNPASDRGKRNDDVPPVIAQTPPKISPTLSDPIITNARPQVAFGLVAVCSNFRFLPPLADKTKDIATQLFHALTDSHFGRFSCRGSKLLLNPSLIEFQATMKELAVVCGEAGKDASFFMCIVSHGARVTSGVNEGSYVLFSETRLSSEEELLLTALHENELAKMIHEIPCKNKLLATELCQVKQAKEKPADEAPTIVNRIHAAFSKRLFDQLVKFELVRQQKEQPTFTEGEVLSAKKGVFNTVILDSCEVDKESPVRSPVDSVSNFLHRLNDAFHGAAAPISLDAGEEPPSRQSFRVRDICAYVKTAVVQDAQRHNDVVQTEYKKQVRTKYELVAEFEDITHTPQLLGLDRLVDFSLGDVPAAPELSPKPPMFVSATISSVTLSWDTSFGGFQPTTSIEVPTILGYHIQIRGDGRASDQWRRAGDFQVLSSDEGFRDKKPLPTQISVHGLPCDAAFRFRLRACSAGGWGPYSAVSSAFRTLSYTSVHDTFSTVASVYPKSGIHGLQELMETYASNRDVLRNCFEFMTRASVKGVGQNRQTIPLNQVVPIVRLVMNATNKFSEDPLVAHSACLFIGRLSQHSETHRKAMLSIREPHRVGEYLDKLGSQFATTHRDTSTMASWATSQLRGVSGRYRMSRDSAAKRIQGLYRTRKARQYMRSLASAVYTQHMDPSTGRSYFYNSTTGTTSWSLPAFLGAS